MILKSEYHSKGWGSEIWLRNGPEYCGKILNINAGHKCSLHFHKLKTETMHISQGSVIMRFGHSLECLEEQLLEAGQTFHIEPLLIHQFEAVSDAQIFEFSTQHFESDSYRLVKGD